MAAFGLPGRADASDSLAVRPEEWPILLVRLAGKRLTGIALAAAEDGWLSLSARQSEELLESQRQVMLQVLALERKLLVLNEAFGQAGVDFVLLKGSALARSVYPDPSWRPFGDLDLLVRTRDWREACSVLEKLGLHRNLPEPRPGFDERFGKASVHGGNGSVEVDLHRTLVLGPFGLWLDPDQLFRWVVPLSLGGQTVRRFDDTAQLLHACMHASLGFRPPLLLPLRDVAQIACFGTVDWGALYESAARWRLGPVIRHAFHTASDSLAVTLPLEAKRCMQVKVHRKERRALDAYITSRRGHGGTAISTLKAIRGTRAKVAYLRAMLTPGREFLVSRTEGNPRASYMRRWTIPIRWMTKRGR